MSIRLGIDIGSTTVKVAAIGTDGDVVFARYMRHNACASEVLCHILDEMRQELGDVEVRTGITGSVGMGFAERYDIRFVQEVVAAATTIRHEYPQVRSMIDIGGEDAKVVFFKDGEAHDLRMNGNCAGGTGAFIDQMAVILGVRVDEMNSLALNATRIYPIASRCGVFCKTDIQNLVARGVSKEDIAASIFHAVAVQTVVTLARGCDISQPVLFCGGPLTFIPALRKAFAEYLHLADSEMIMPSRGTLLPAIGTALSLDDETESIRLSSLTTTIQGKRHVCTKPNSGLQPIFSSEEEYQKWSKQKSENHLPTAQLKAGVNRAFLGIDSGSTTTKIILTDTEGRILFSYYAGNSGNPIGTVEKGLQQLQEECRTKSAELQILGSCSTGYGEDLIKAAFQLGSGIVETMAHYISASSIDPQVSFILDIGGQDMKAMTVTEGVIDRIEINEACSSGCGSFIETFAKTLGYTPSEFARLACRSSHPCDLGTRCTVFMNSKVKQVLREGATIEDIAAGLDYSVVKNCLYKVLKLKDTASLGNNIVVQGGTMRNDGVVRALELLTGATVSRTDKPEMMGAYGCALYASEHQSAAVGLQSLLAKSIYTTSQLHCKGCDNQCTVTRYLFTGGNKYYSGNRCERVFSNGERHERATNVYRAKNELLFSRATSTIEHPLLHIGIPRSLNMYEDFAFWHALFTECGIAVVLSDVSNYARYECSARKVMSDNICFPAKLVHSHIKNLIDKGVDRIFMPFVIFEHCDKKEQNSYNCPIVTGYSEVIKSVQNEGIAIDSPSISFKDRGLLLRQCTDYLSTLGIKKSTAKKAFARAEQAQADYNKSIYELNRRTLDESLSQHRPVILLAGRPYHADPLIQHKVSDMIAGMGVSVITEDIARESDCFATSQSYLAQWSYPNRILKAAQWCCQTDSNVQFIQLTSFGCGPDAFLSDEVRACLMHSGKPHTMLKLDDINNIGSMRLRVRSLIESVRLSTERNLSKSTLGKTVSTPIYDQKHRKKTVLLPYFTPYISPLLPSIMRAAGYEAEALPLSNSESCEWGLRYANNEVCYPATLIVGDIIRAFKSGKYHPDESVIAMTQTGGQCRASNYIPIIKKALVEAGYTDTPVISLSVGGNIKNEQPAFTVDWIKMLPIALRAVLFSDAIAKFYNATRPRETHRGAAEQLKKKYLEQAARLIEAGRSSKLFDCLGEAARSFNKICRAIDCPRVGIVGEIFLKFNPFAHHNIGQWLSERGMEVVPSALADFFVQEFVNRDVRVQTHIEHSNISDIVFKLSYNVIRRQIERVNTIAKDFRYYIPFGNIYDEAAKAKPVVTLNAQFGEGWLLPAEILSMAEHGVKDVISMQPFGCIANHIVSKGIEKRIRSLVPDINILSLDFDSGVSDVNITNRLLLFVDQLRNRHQNSTATQTSNCRA